MDAKLAYKVIEELRQQCRFASMGYQRIRAAVNEQDAERAFLDVDGFLRHAWMVSRLLWPTRAESGERGEWLRKELNVAPASVLKLDEWTGLMARPDEIFEDWLKSLDDCRYVDMNLMPVGTLAGFKQDTFHRSLDPETFKLSLGHQKCDLRKIWEELKQLDAVISRWMKTHNPW